MLKLEQSRFIIYKDEPCFFNDIAIQGIPNVVNPKNFNFFIPFKGVVKLLSSPVFPSLPISTPPFFLFCSPTIDSSGMHSFDIFFIETQLELLHCRSQSFKPLIILPNTKTN